MAKLKGGTRIYGDVKIDGGIRDSNNAIGIGGSVLISTGVGIAWTSGAASGINSSANTTIVSTDAGKYISATGTIIIDTNTNFANGNMCTIYNNSAAQIQITATTITLRLAGSAATGNRFLAQRGLANIICVNADSEYVISGAGLT